MTQDLVSQRKQKLRRKLRDARRLHFDDLPDMVRALVFSRPPGDALALIPDRATIGLYHATGAEAPTLGYAKWFHENGHALALPWFADRQSAMVFRQWHDPYDEDELSQGPFGLMQPQVSSAEAVPDVLIVPLVGFTASGDRLGQGGGHYDRWIEEHPDAITIGLGWDCQRLESLPHENHDRPLALVVTPTRIYAGKSDA
ncbi:MAG: 5-formyltetrahydrofolate cyclo-ligase [Novosphingobium sp.]|nr:5-formyltetrahydrofolate cyclo-ligase [Novosphingobium sp.]